MSRQSQAEAKKSEGNKAFASSDFDTAIDLYTQAINFDAQNHVYFSNRSAAYTAKGDYESAIEDGRMCTQLNAKWAKGWFRLANAQKAARKFLDCQATLKKGLHLNSEHKDLLTLRTEIEQDVITEEAALRSGMSRDEQLKFEGNDLFKKAKFEDAIKKYGQALEACGDHTSALAVACYNNRAGCHQQLNNHVSVVEDSTMVLDVNPKNEKALLRRGLSFEALEKYRSGLADLRALLLINANIPMANAARNRMQECVRKLKMQK